MKDHLNNTLMDMVGLLRCPVQSQGWVPGSSCPFQPGILHHSVIRRCHFCGQGSLAPFSFSLLPCTVPGLILEVLRHGDPSLEGSKEQLDVSSML